METAVLATVLNSAAIILLFVYLYVIKTTEVGITETTFDAVIKHAVDKDVVGTFVSVIEIAELSTTKINLDNYEKVLDDVRVHICNKLEKDYIKVNGNLSPSVKMVTEVINQTLEKTMEIAEALFNRDIPGDGEKMHFHNQPLEELVNHTEYDKISSVSKKLTERHAVDG